MLKVGEYDLLLQGDNYRKKDTERDVKALIGKHKRNKKPIVIDTITKTIKKTEVKIKPITDEEITEAYTINDETYTLVVKFVNEGDDLFWLDTSQEEDKIIKCMVNCNHKFFELFPLKKSGRSSVSLLKALAVAKYCHQSTEVDDMVENFNEILNKL